MLPNRGNDTFDSEIALQLMPRGRILSRSPFRHHNEGGVSGANILETSTAIQKAWAVAPSFESILKRSLDIAVSLSLLILLSPAFLVISILIKATDGGPILFRQTRVGRNGREFPFSKFRSMVPDAEKKLTSILHLNQHKAGVTFKIKNDPRITWIGHILRRTSFDELPQLWSVLVGDMTLVGPRPALPREVALYTLDERQRLNATPGLTGIWQVRGRGDLPFPIQVQMDLEYIESQSFLLDLKILLLTVPAVLSGKGAY